MDTLVWLAVPAAFLVFLIIVCAAVVRNRRVEPKGDAPNRAQYESRKQLLTACELNFFRVLEQSVPTHIWISSKVRLADVLKPKHTRSRGAFNRIASKHLDFVLCDRGTSEIVCVIELNDSSHNTLERGFRDGLVEEWLSTSGVKLLTIKASESYRPEELRKLIGLGTAKQSTIADPDAKYRPRL